MRAHTDMVLVEVAPDDKFVVLFEDTEQGPFEDPIEACNVAEKLARTVGAKWDVTIQARNAADMS